MQYMHNLSQVLMRLALVICVCGCCYHVDWVI